MPEGEEEKLTLSVVQTSRLLGIGRSLTYELIRQGRIPAIRFGRLVRVPRCQLQRLLEGRKDSSIADEEENIRGQNASSIR